ncbi:MAG: sodium:solute symporter family protein [Opitutales bacterium]|nr:sodium:solute symporter family protein [Opitutales bacterium]
MSKIKNSGDFFMGGRRFGKILMIAQAFGVGTHTDQPVTVSGAAYQSGLAGIWYQWIFMFSTPFFWIIAPVYRRLRYITMADFFQERYGSGISFLYTLIALLYFCMNMGVMLKGTGVTVEGLTGGALSEEVVIIVSTILFISYGLAGGIVAAVYTDLVQGILILVLSFMLLPFAINMAGGMSVFHSELPEYMFSLVAPNEVTWFFIVMAVINGLVMVVVLPHHMAIGGSGKTEISCRTGWTYGNFLKRFATAGWAFIGVFAAFLFPELIGEHREMAFGIAAKELLPVGLVGLMLAAMIAAVMSTCDAFMVHASALFTQNIYRPYVKPSATDRELLVVGRWASLGIVAGGIMFAYSFPSVVHGIKEGWKITAYMGIAFWAGIMWKRANRWGTLASVVSMAFIGIYTQNQLDWGFAQQAALYLPVGFTAMIVVSAFTKMEPENKLHAFYTLLDTPVGEEQRLRDAGIEIKLEGASDANEATPNTQQSRVQHSTQDRLIIVDLLSLPSKFSWKAYRTDILGFLAAAAIGALTILAVYLLSRIGA